MNAVKRCLALFAVTLVVGACGSDQTADDAGTNLHIRTTPGAVWTRHNSTPATFVVDAIDNLGGNTEGSWDVESVTGPMTVDLDTAYQSTSNGPLGLAARFIVTPTAAGDGFVVVTGTGGTDTVPVRIAPDTGAFAVVFSDSSSALHQTIVATAPAGLVFTGGTTVRFFSGSQSRDTSNGGLSFPSVIARNADSSQITFVTGPGAFGTARFTGLASRSTPTLVTTARANFAMTAPTPTVDTTAFSVAPAFRTTGTRATASVLDTLVLTAPANYVFLASSKAELWRFTLDANGNTVRTVSNGTSAPFTIGRSADSTKLYVAMAPGGRGRLQVNKIAFQVAPAIQFNVNGPSSETFDLRQGASGPDTSNFAITFSKASPIAEGDTVTATAPAGMVFLPGTVMINAGTSGTPSGGDSARIVLISADSSKVTFRLPPGASGKFRYSAMARRDYPAIVWGGRSATTISAVAAPAVVATLTPGTANMNDTVTVVLDPAGPYRFRPTSVGLVGGFVGMVASVSTDSLTMKILPPPGFSGAMTLTNIRYANLPTFQVQAATASTVTVNAATSLGGDDPKAGPAIPIITAPDSVGRIVGFWDQATMGAPDYTGDGGPVAQYYRIVAPRTGNVNFKVDWTQTGPDVDFILVEDDGAYDAPVGNVTSGAASGKPENATYALVAGHTYVLAIVDFRHTSPALINTNGVKVTMVGQ